MLTSIGMVVGVIIAIKGTSYFSDAKVTHLVAFDLKTDIGGLRVGDEVRIGGFKVGEVERIILKEDQDPRRPPYYLVIAISVPKKYSIREDAELRIGGTLTGTSWLNFEFLGKGNALPDEQVLIGRGSPTAELLVKAQSLEPRLNSILKQIDEQTVPNINGVVEDVKKNTVPLLNQTLDKYGKTADSATALSNDIRSSYKPIIEKYNAVADKAVAMMESIRALFGDTTEDFRTTVANLRKATSAFSEKLPGMLTKIDGTLGKIDTAVDQVNKSLVELHTTVVNAKEITGNAREVIVGNRSKIDGMIDSVKKAGDNLKNATAEVRRSPWRLLYKPAPGEVTNLTLYDSARQFAEGANDLNDAAAALRDAIKSGKGSEEELKPLIDKLEKSFSGFKEVEQKLWTDVKE